MGSKYWKRQKLSTGHGAVNRRGVYRQSRPFCLIFHTYAPAHTRHPRDLGGLRRPAGACRPAILRRSGRSPPRHPRRRLLPRQRRRARGSRRILCRRQAYARPPRPRAGHAATIRGLGRKCRGLPSIQRPAPLRRHLHPRPRRARPGAGPRLRTAHRPALPGQCQPLQRRALDLGAVLPAGADLRQSGFSSPFARSHHNGLRPSGRRRSLPHCRCSFPALFPLYVLAARRAYQAGP